MKEVKKSRKLNTLKNIGKKRRALTRALLFFCIREIYMSFYGNERTIHVFRKAEINMDKMGNLENYEALANAIIAQAAEDYLNLKKRLDICPGNENRGERGRIIAEMTKIKKFFRSEWFTTLAPEGVKGDDVIKRLNDLHKQLKLEEANG